MGLLDASKTSAAFKVLYGKTLTDTAKEIGNEAILSGIQTSAATVFGEIPSGAPSTANLYDITNANVEFVRLELVADPSSNGHAFLARLPAGYVTGSSNPKKNTGFYTAGQYLYSTNGGIQIVPPLYGLSYEAKPYTGGTAAKGSGTLVPPGDARDWLLNYFNGVFFQEDNPSASPTAPTYLECFIYIGKSVQDVTDTLSTQAGSTGDIITRQANLDVVGSEVIDTVTASNFMSVEWMINATKGNDMYSCNIKASHHNGDVKHSEYNIAKFGSVNNNNFISFDVVINGAYLELSATAVQANIAVNVVRIAIK